MLSDYYNKYSDIILLISDNARVLFFINTGMALLLYNQVHLIIL